MPQNANHSNGIGLFGGTFDPVHIGHLRTAVELRKVLNLSEMRLIPSACPPHRTQPDSSAEHRLAMLQLALGHGLGPNTAEPKLIADDKELRREGLSYTMDTLTEVRAEVGTKTPLFLCIGMDSLIDLNQWHRWRELTSIAHIVVAARPGWQEIPAGKILMMEMTLLPVSATGIRQALQRGESIRYLVPDQVIDYIRQHQLYSDKKDTTKQEAT